MQVYVDYIQLLHSVISSKKDYSRDINILKEYDFGNGLGTLTLSIHIHRMFLVLMGKNIYDEVDKEKDAITFNHLSSQYTPNKHNQVYQMFYTIQMEDAKDTINYFEFERYICCLGFHDIRKIMSCILMYNFDSDTLDICYIPKEYGTMCKLKKENGTSWASRTESKIPKILSSCFGNAETYENLSSSEEERAPLQN